jgi:3-isopropylmalate dehydrogenase
VTTARRRYVVACLAGDGIGPEVMAEASRALGEVSSLHGFRVDEVHPPFGGEALLRAGHPLPPATRQATLAADAVLVAGSSQPALEGVKAELDLGASVVRTQLAGGDAVTIFAPLQDEFVDWAIERAFAAARARDGRLVSVGVGAGWRERVERVARHHDGVAVCPLTLAQALQELAVGSTKLRVVVTESGLADALAEAPRLRGGFNRTASGHLSVAGPGLFGPTHGAAHDIAGQGVANPTEMLLAVALLLGEGLGRHAAAETLEGSVAAALRGPERTPDLSEGGRLASGTREFVDVVLGLLPSARRDMEFALEGAQ